MVLVLHLQFVQLYSQTHFSLCDDVTDFKCKTHDLLMKLNLFARD